MSYHETISEFLRKAQDAEARTRAATDPFVRAEWARIALTYRDLAETVRTTAVMEELSKSPSHSSF